MASKIKIFRSTGATAPNTLEYGELAITVEQGTTGTSANKAGRLFIGNASGNPVEIGGEYTYKLMDHTHGELINSSVAIVDNNGEINGWNVAGILTATRTNFTSLVTSDLNVTGVATFAQGINLNGNVTIGDAASDTLTVNATTGFTTSVSFSSGINVTGVATCGILSATGNANIDGTLHVGGIEVTGGASIGADITTRNLRTTGISTFQGIAQFNDTIDVDGQAIFDDITVSAGSTFDGLVDINAGANVSGGTGLVVSANGLNVTGVSTFSTDLIVGGDVRVTGGDIKSNTGATALTLNAQDVTVAGDLRINGNDIKASDGNINISLTSNTLTTFAGDIRVGGNDIQASNGNVNITMTSNTLTAFAGGIKVAGNTIQDSSGSTVLSFSGINQNVTAENNLTVDGSLIASNDASVGGALTVTGAVDFNGGVNISGGETVLSSATVSDLTNNRVVIAGTSGALEDDANFTFDGTTLNVGATIDATVVDAATLRAPVGVVTALTSTDIVGTAATFTSALTMGSGGTKYTLTNTDGAAGQVLTTNGSGSVSFQEVSSTLVISAGAGVGNTDAVDLRTETFTIAATNNETKTTLTNNTITVGLSTDVIVGGGLTVTNNLLVLGNLTVEGTETIINVERLDVQDKTIGVASTSTANNSTANGGGFFVHGGGDGDKTIFWSLAQGGFEVNQDWLPNADGTFDLGNSSREWQNLFVDGLAELDDVNVSAAATIATLNVTGTGTIATADINGGNIDGTVIGAASSAAATLTTVNYTSLTGGAIVATGSRVDAGDVTFTNLRVTGVSTVASLLLSTGTNTNGVAFFDANGQVTSTATPSAGIQTSNFILTTNASGVPSWTDTIDGGQF